MYIDEIIQNLRELKSIYEKNGINILGVFGSFAKGNNTDNSDIDIAYTLKPSKFFEQYKGFAAASKIAEVKEELSEKLHRKVDLISLENSNKELVNNMKKELIYV